MVQENKTEIINLKKIVLITFATIIGLIAIWYAFLVVTAKPVDPMAADGGAAMIKYQQERIRKPTE